MYKDASQVYYSYSKLLDATFAGWNGKLLLAHDTGC